MGTFKITVEGMQDDTTIDFTIAAQDERERTDQDSVAEPAISVGTNTGPLPSPSHPQAFQQAMELVERTVYAAD